MKNLGIFIICIIAISCSQSNNLAIDLGQNQRNLQLNKTSITVSGISSGGYMAHQYHIAYSEQVEGPRYLPPVHMLVHRVI